MPSGGDAMSVSEGSRIAVRKKRNVVLYLDKELVENARELDLTCQKQWKIT